MLNVTALSVALERKSLLLITEITTKKIQTTSKIKIVARYSESALLRRLGTLNRLDER
jgi:hypothetical protein